MMLVATWIDTVAETAQSSTFWIIVGFLGQAVFGLRFIVQWIASERAGRSTMPVVFWYLSIVGGLILLTYAIYKRDPVFIVGQSMGSIVYFRNLALVARERRASEPSSVV